MRLGNARHLGAIEFLEEQRPDFSGEPLREWSELATTYVGFEQEAETVLVDNDKVERLRTTTAYIRYPGFKVQPNVMRIRARGETYSIISAVEVDARDRWLKLTLKSGDENG